MYSQCQEQLTRVGHLGTNDDVTINGLARLLLVGQSATLPKVTGVKSCCSSLRFKVLKIYSSYFHQVAHNLVPIYWVMNNQDWFSEIV